MADGQKTGRTSSSLTMDKISQPLITIVVTIYKVERYLRECIDSILGQTLQNIEVILVDDGSPDGCPAIVDEYAAKDARVVAVHQPNGGYGKAINHGISLARAPYIGIIDSDDWIEPTMYEKLYNRAIETQADVVKCMFWKYDSTAMPEKQNELWNSDLLNWFAAPDGVFKPTDWSTIFALHSSLWSYLYRADFVRAIPLMETDSAAYQDFPFIIEVLGRAKSVSLIKEPLLHYRMEANQGSSTMRNDARLIQMPIMTLRGAEILEELGILNEVKEPFFYHAFIANIGFLLKIRREHAKEFYKHFSAVISKIKQYPDFQFSYFNKKELKRINKILNNKGVNSLRHKWKLRFKKGLLSIRINGRDIKWRLWNK